MTRSTLTAFAAVIAATAPSLLAADTKTPTVSEQEVSYEASNILMGSDADVPFHTNSPINLGKNRLAFSRIGLKSDRGPVENAAQAISALDDDDRSVVSLPADGSTSLEMRFIGQPRWINIIEIQGTLSSARIEVLTTDGRWGNWGEVESTGNGLVVTGPAARYMGVRITPNGLSSTDTIEIAEVNGRFEQVDPDAANRAEGDGKSYFYEWVENYSSSPLSNTSEDATRLGDQLPSDWSVTGFGNSSAWEEDFKRTEYGGTNNSYADEHDLVFFSGHGTTTTNNGEYYSDSTRCIKFSNSSHDDKYMSAGDAYDSWGDDDMEWLGMSACQTMKQDDRWSSSMNGVHLVMGWQTNMYDVKNFGKKFAKRMIDSGAFDSAYPVLDSWFYAAEQTHWYADRTAEVIGETTSMGNDYVWGEGSVNSDPTDNSSYTRWSYDTRGRDSVLGHQAQAVASHPVEFRGDAATIRISRDVLDGFRGDSRPHYTDWHTLMAPTVNAESAAVLSNNLCERLGMLCQADIGPDGEDLEMIAVAGDQEVRIWRTDGAVDVIDRSAYLQQDPNFVPQLISHGEAREKADQIFNVIGIPMQDRVLVHEDFLWTDVDLPKADAGNDQGESHSFTTRTRLIYRRQINGAPTWGPGGEATIEFGHEGALAKASVQAWTNYEPAGQVYLMELEPLLEEIAQRGNQLFINNIRQPMNQIQIDNIEVGYWIKSRGIGQDILLPCYGLSCTVQDGEGEATGVHLVINAAVHAPKIDVQDEAGNQGCYLPGEPVCFTASAESFYGEAEIRWIDPQNGAVIGSGEQFCHTFSEGDPNRVVRSRSIEARVKDSLGTVSSATATVCVSIPGDVDGDNAVGVNDLLVVLDNWNHTGSPWSGGDVNGDGLSGIDDLLLILSGWSR